MECIHIHFLITNHRDSGYSKGKNVYSDGGEFESKRSITIPQSNGDVSMIGFCVAFMKNSS